MPYKAAVVEVETVDDIAVTEPAKDQAAYGVGDSDDGEKEGSILLINAPTSGPVHCVDVRNIEPDAG